MFRRDKNNKLDNEGLRRMREAIRQRLDEETAAAGETTQPVYPPATPTGEGAYTYESLPAEPDYSYLREHEAGQPRGEAQPAPVQTGIAGQRMAGLPAVLGDLCLQRRQSVKLLLRPQEVDQRHPEVAAVEVAGEIEEMDLELDAGAAHGRPAAEIGDAVAPDRAPALVDAGLDRIDAQRRLEVLPSGHISGQIQAGAIIVQEGAFLGGQLRMRSQETTDEGDPSRPMLQRVR